MTKYAINDPRFLRAAERLHAAYLAEPFGLPLTEWLDERARLLAAPPRANDCAIAVRRALRDFSTRQ